MHLAAADRLSLRLLGEFQLVCHGRDVTPRGRKARGMLAFLALSAGQRASREQLAALFWTDRGQEQARASLRQTLAELKAVPGLASVLRTSRNMVQLEGIALVVDCLEIERVARKGDLDALASALEAAGTDLLDDLSDVAAGFQDWLLIERTGQREKILVASIEAVEADGLRDMKSARLVLRSLDRIDPYNEAVARLGMRLDHAAGDMAALHRRHKSLQDRLQSEFGVAPSEETRRLFHSLAEGGGGPRDVPPTSRRRPQLDLDLEPTVIVAPLQTYGADKDLIALVAFCADEIRTALSAIRGIRVLDARTADVQQLSQWCGDSLGLYLLSGSAHQIGTELRIALQLSDAESQVIVWSDSPRFSIQAEDVIDQIVTRAASAVMPVIDSELEGRMRAGFDEINDARALYTHARLMIRQTTSLEMAQEGARLLEQLIERNPKHLGAHLLLARMYNSDFWLQVCGHDVAAYRAMSERHVRAALAIAPGRTEVRIRHAWCLMRSGQWAQAKSELDAVLGKLSHDPDIVNECGFALCCLGDFAQSRELLQRAFFLNPSPRSDYHADYAVLLCLEGEAQAAEEHFIVSGEQGLHYTAIRIANTSRLNEPPRGQSELVQDFIRRFRLAWCSDREPELCDVMDWIGYAVPFKHASSLDLVRTGLRKLLAPAWPAARGSG